MAAFIAALHLIGWGTLTAVVAPGRYDPGSAGVFGIGLDVTACVLGMRHAFDADHIAAIDNTTRKLMADRQRPLSVGFWFSLGHSSVVFGLCFLLAVGSAPSPARWRTSARGSSRRRDWSAPSSRACSSPSSP
jgi:high-affinity nickel-transport protein